MSFDGRKTAESRVSVTEALTTADANILIPKVISQVIAEAAEPLYLASQFFQKIQLNEGRSMEFLHFGAIRAFEIGEGMEYPNQTLNLAKQGIGSVDVRVKKYGLKCQITDEMIADSQWDVIGLHLKASGRAMARKQEEVIFEEFSKHGHIVFDAKEYAPGEEGYPTGRGFNGEYNGTLSADDIIDMSISILAAGYTPTTIIMHPLCWSLFAKNAALEGSSVAAFGQGTVSADPRTFNTTNALGLEIVFSPFIGFNHVEKTFDFVIVDKNNVGVLVMKDEISTEQFEDPLRDIQTLKIKSRYGVGILNGGLGVAVAKHIKFAKTYPAPAREFEKMPLPSDYKGQGALDKDEI